LAFVLSLLSMLLLALLLERLVLRHLVNRRPSPCSWPRWA
jgi:branched-chain amino acid transport system permease protein